ncbi:hypothetical protein F0562_014892 [Nyssa sinensis]|uniref:Mediator complex subunit Med12 LCEWAV-domain domain-containing protein n=1 Tax=Nyssa sinensis TaxID=561372 RepID=A0A5J4ZS95_9ASTE|nr:hypothetical protein F0562_014892 [Nyssa sinensis]
MVYAGSIQHKSDPTSALLDGEEPSLHFKWWYMVRILQWHHSEGLLLPSLIIDWVLNQLQEKDLLRTLQLLLPIIYGVIETIVLSQTYVRTIVGIAIRFIQDPSPGGSDLVDNSRRAYTTSASIEMLRYLLLAVPDTFVALDCFLLPPSVVSDVVNDGSFFSKVTEDAGKIKNGSRLGDKGLEAQCQSLSIGHVVSSIQKCTYNLAMAARPGYPGCNVAKAVQELDKALIHGDVRMAYRFLFEDLSCGAVDESWTAEVSPCLRSSLKWIGTVSLSFICSVFFLCEWATCDFRDFRTAPPLGLKFTGRKDLSQIYIAIRLLKLKIRDLQSSLRCKNESAPGVNSLAKGPGQPSNYSGTTSVGNVYESKTNLKSVDGRIKDLSGFLQSPGPLHDIVVCWIDQHESQNGEGFRLLQLLIIELTRSGIFYPQAYVRQLIVSGIMDNGPLIDLVRRKRHYKILKQLPGPYIRDALEEARIAEAPVLSEAMHIYSNERRLVLHGLVDHKNRTSANSSSKKQKHHPNSGRDNASPTSLPNSSTSTDAGLDESQGSLKKPAGLTSNKTDVGEGTPGCEECRRIKRQKLNEERSSYVQGHSPNLSDDEDAWWARKGPKCTDSFKADAPLKPAKQASRGRQKNVRKTQSLAHLAAARIEGSQGASTSHICDSRISCPHHRTVFEGEAPKSMDGIRTTHCRDIVSIGKSLKQLAPDFCFGYCPRFIVAPLLQSIMGGPILMLQRNAGSQVCEVGDTFLLSSIRRYENILVATDLIPETLSATMHCAATAMASNGRVSGSAALVYARYLLRKYGNVASVVEWEKNFKATCDKRLISELESGRSLDGEFGFPLGVPAGVEDPDDFLRQKISGGRLSRVGLSMRDIVQRHVEEAFQVFFGKERKLFAAGTVKGPALEKWDDGNQIAQQIVIGLMDCIRQTGGAAQEGDPPLVSSAVAAIINNIGPVVAKIPDLTASGNQPNFPTTTGSLNFARRILRIHITCLCLLKEVLGERQSRVFDIALATEASSALAQVFAPGKAPRSQFQMSPEAHDSNANLSNENLNNSTKAVLGRAAKTTAAISALVVGAVLHGVASLERMVTVFRLKEGLDVIHFVRCTRSNSNGNARSIGTFKVDNLVEVSVHWFRVLVGNCRPISDGLIVELLGEASIVALSRMQRTLPLSLVFPPAYSIFAFVIWKPFVLNTREDTHQLYQSLTLAIGDAIKHLPFRDVCMRDTHGLYNLIVADASDSEFATMLELKDANMHLKTMAFIPLRARLFLNAIIDCKMPVPMFTQDDGNRGSGHADSKVQYGENGAKLLDKLVNVLDTLQPAKFHWQWIELRLLLNEQALIEKLEAHDTSLAEAIRSLSPNPDKAAASENENNFVEMILTRLLVRPDAAALYSEVVHLLGRSLEDSMLLQAKWFLGGQDVLFGRKSIRQRLINIAESQGLSTKPQFWKPWGWCYSSFDLATNKGDKRKFEATSLEEGEVVEEGTDNQSSDDSRSIFASDLIKQMNNIEQQINVVTRGANKQAGTVTSGIEGPGNKGNNRKGMRGGSPGLARRLTATADTVPPSPAALRASMSLRLQFLLRLLPIIYADGEPYGRNMRHLLASVILRLLGSRVVHEDADQSFYPTLSPLLKREVESSMEASAAASVDLSCGSLFDRLLLVLHGLLSSSRPSWLKSKPGSKSTTDCSKDFCVFDREIAESLQNDLDRMQLPDKIRWRIQAAMPILFPSARWSISCQPPSVSPAAPASLQPSILISGLHPGNSNLPQRNSVSLIRPANNVAGKTKPLPIQQDVDMEIDPWTLLEDGAGSGPSSSNTAVIGGSDQANLRASSWLKGAIRVRRTDLTYIGAVDDDS